MEAKREVCVTGASGFIASLLVMKLLQRGYHVRATVRDPGNENKVKHLLNMPNAATNLTLWKADLSKEGSFDDAINGCVGVFHLATPLDFAPDDPENDIIKPTVNGVIDILKACVKAKTVKRVIYTSTTATIALHRQPPPEFNETVWTDIDFCRSEKMDAWMYFVAKTTAEKRAWEFADENGIDLVTVIPPLVFGPFLTPSRPITFDMTIALLTKNEFYYQALISNHGVHVEDVCDAHIYLFETPQAKGRYICSSHPFTILDLANYLHQKYPEYNVPTEFKDLEARIKPPIPCVSKKLMELGFKFKYNPEEYEIGDLCSEAIESCKQKGLMPV